jgi:hypothetical protein
METPTKKQKLNNSTYGLNILLNQLVNVRREFERLLAQVRVKIILYNNIIFYIIIIFILARKYGYKYFAKHQK